MIEFGIRVCLYTLTTAFAPLLTGAFMFLTGAQDLRSEVREGLDKVENVVHLEAENTRQGMYSAIQVRLPDLSVGLRRC
jgi:hypothetical protein